MKKILLLPTLLLTGVFSISNAVGQAPDARVTIEMKDGKLFINGDSAVISGGVVTALSKAMHRPFLGVQTKSNEKGAEVVSVVPGSPAERAGLQKGDVITNVNGKNIKDPEGLADVIGAMKINEVAQITILRDNAERELSATLGEPLMTFNLNDTMPILRINPYRFRMPNPFNDPANPDQPRYRVFKEPLPGQRFRDAPNRIGSARPNLGLQIQDTQDDSGVTVLKVTPESPAQKAGVKEGDLITSIGGNRVANVADAQREIRDTKGTEYKLQIQRDKKTITLTIKIPKKLNTANL